MSNGLIQFLGDTPLRTIVKLAIVSLVVGIIMAALQVTPFELWDNFFGAIQWAIERGLSLFGDFGKYLVYGGVVVIPIFLITRLLNLRK